VSLQGLLVLVVDDDAEAGSILHLILDERGARVASVHSVDEALRALASNRFDLLISNIGMQGRDGYELIRELRELETPGTHLPTIALTAFSRDVDRHQALQAGFDAHLAKPLKPQVLMRVVEQLAGTAA
jgi:CheY-like chemotaxis protein